MTKRFLAVVVTLVAGVLAPGCSHGIWKPNDRRSIPIADRDTMLAVTESRAVEFEVSDYRGGAVIGTVKRSWNVSPADGAKLDRRPPSGGDLEPAALARRLNWQERNTPANEQVAVPLRDLRYLQIYDPRTGRRAGLTLLGVTGGALMVSVLAGTLLLSMSNGGGRPLRVHGRPVVTRAARNGDWTEEVAIRSVPDDVATTLRALWEAEARMEHASIAAFSKLALELIAVGGPPELIARASRAAIQEVEHARLCFALASAYGGVGLGPAPLPQALTGDTADIVRIAREALVDGCVGEAVAAELCQHGAEHAADPAVARVRRGQAADEAEHAALAWAVVEWVLARGGQEVCRALLAALPEARMPRCTALPEHGWPGQDVVRPIFDRALSAARARLEGYQLAPRSRGLATDRDDIEHPHAA